MKLIAKKPCSFGGKKFFVGEEIPLELVVNPATQEKFGTLTIVDSESINEAPEPIVIPAPSLSITVKTGDTDMILEPSSEGIQDVFNVLVGKASEAETIISQMDDNDALILLHLADSRKSIKEAAEARAKEISGEQ